MFIVYHAFVVILQIHVLFKLAKTFGVTMDYLFDESIDGVESISLKNKSLVEKIELIEELSKKDQETIINVIESMSSKHRMKEFLKTELNE